MTTGLEHLEYRRLRAPGESGTALVEPPMDEVLELVHQNRQRRRGYDYDFQGRSLVDLARQARQELVAAARRWTAQYRDLSTEPFVPDQPLFLAGHQPQLFHPGVWFKNFMLGALAGRHGAQAINLIIDSDTIRSVSLSVPGGTVEQPQLATIPFDEPGPAVPYEERPILSPASFESLGRRAVEHICSLVRHPLLESYWPMVVARARETDNLGACLAQSRHQLEGAWGSATLEIPQSRVCDLPSFAWFTAHLLAHLPRLRLIYNDVVAEYRRSHHIRSTAHPVPDLAAEDGWIESPFWIWTSKDPRRRRLFAQPRDEEILITDLAGLELPLPLSAETDVQPAAERLTELGRRGIKIRSRALITTLWARLVLGDLFLHGIGGAKYDQVTDALLAQFFGLQPPRYLVVSASFHLPITRQVITEEDLRRVDRRLRDLTYHPERILEENRVGRSASDASTELIEAKRRWIRTPQVPENAAIRFHEFHRINAALQPWLSDERQRLLDRRDHLAASLRRESLLSSRQYAFCLFPEELLRREFARLLSP